jgi:hypothetical protein
MMMHLGALLIAALIAAVFPAAAEDQSKCSAAPPVLWGDGEHDDTAALNAWFRGETVLWAQTHDVVGSEIADHSTKPTVYIHSGTGRKMERFRWFGASQRSCDRGRRGGKRSRRRPVVDGITKVNADPDEGVPYDGPKPAPRHGVPGTA